MNNSNTSKTSDDKLQKLLDELVFVIQDIEGNCLYSDKYKPKILKQKPSKKGYIILWKIDYEYQVFQLDARWKEIKNIRYYKDYQEALANFIRRKV